MSRFYAFGTRAGREAASTLEWAEVGFPFSGPSAMRPRKVFLFSGHMIDSPDRNAPRFPADAEPVAHAAIARKLNDLGADTSDLAVCSGACGGDLLFAENVLARGVPLEMYLPFDESSFLSTSVAFAGKRWVDRFRTCAASATLHLMPQERGPLPQDADAYEQNNLWMLEAASRFGADRVDFICLWNGLKGDGPGGAQHLWKEVERGGGRAHWLKTTELW
jgi:hypothetical protein